MTPENRACHEYAYRVVLGFMPDSDVHVMRNLKVVTNSGIEEVDPSGYPTEALICALAQTMQFHLTGVQFGELRNDLIAAGMGVEAANLVHDHLVDVSVEEWARLRERVVYYAHDNASPILASSAEEGL
ncbi:MAG: hypothetical protein KUG70_14745 [Rhodobacteraceae bacterium]|nr:hypothetical protein [Paracoccaceae bacterium]